jgi:DNA-binding PadR family transcriptional regulator
MSLDHAILGFLQYRPFSGYDLKKIFDNSVRHFWPADQSQIYRTLARLAEEGWTEMEVVEQDSRPNRKVFHITGSGRKELRRWLSTQIEGEETRSASLIQVFFAAQLGDEEVLAMFERAATALRGLLDTYAAAPDHVQVYHDMIGSGRERFFWMLTLECGIAGARAQLEWVESVIRRIRDKDYSNIPEVRPQEER